ncbi:hypothetical protein FEM48_Zijuj06G0075300 [Ziziphus jujuba var. spinosa]|uniref:Wall-associated receptor kinase-like 14 n=1 Tax=Ziziphus jujuba var. spinosa TaxID=714518 RepID=A0A978V7Z7_ZIZJJ|nr:hypothetical protein FEM48_Zijuj06G0075300 [Ziziphus jujuba var. spinosa]
MIRNDLKLILILAFITVVHAICERSCRSSQGVQRTFDYPFGFSADCEIQLNCKSTGEVHIGEFPVKSVDPESIRVDIQRNCNRPLHTLQQLYGHKYAPTSRNGILLENCSEPFSTCVIPGIQVPAHFDSMNCSSNSNISCYSEDKSLAFIDFDNVKSKRCDYLLSSISSESLNLEIRVVELGWWLDGSCDQLCHRNANCTNIQPPHGKPAHRCSCKKGFQGDGYKAGIGCRKTSTGCNPTKYLSGECGGKTRVFTLVGGIAAGSSLMISLATDRIGKGCLDEIIDPFLEPNRDAWTLSSVHKVAELAFRCLAFHRDMRPSMTEVAAELEQIRLSRWASSEEITFTATASPELSTCSSFSNVSEKPLNVNYKTENERRGKYLVHARTGDGSSLNSMEKLKDGSPVSVQDPWFSEQSSPSSNSLLGNAIQ